MKSIFVFLICLFSVLAHGGTISPPIRAKAAILFNPDNGAILYEKQIDQPQYPASILKIATALVALEHLPLDHMCKVSARALKMVQAEEKQSQFSLYPSYVLEHDAQTIGLKEGEVYPLHFLLQALLVNSASDAANVVAENVAGSIDQFMEEMNLYLKKKGIEHTFLCNPHGLYDPMQMTTAYDMAKLMALACQNRSLSGCAMMKTVNWSKGQFRTTNRLLRENDPCFYKKAVWGKTGYTASSGYNLVAVARDKGRDLIAVILGCKKSNERFEDAIALFEAAFAERTVRRLLLSAEHESFSCAVARAKNPLYAHLGKDVAIEYFPSEEPQPHLEVIWHQRSLPILSGVEVGKLVVSDRQKRGLLEAPLYASYTLEASLYGKLLGWSEKHLHWIMGDFCALVFTLFFLQFFKKLSKRTRR